MKYRFIALILLCATILPAAGLAQTASDSADPFPEDAVLALSSTVAQMRGWPIEGLPVTLMPGGNFQFREKAFQYEGFNVSHVELLDLKFLADNPLHRYMQAVIHFTDANGRLGLAQMAAEYALYENQGIMLRNTAVWPVFTHGPRFEMYAVPLPLFEAAGKDIAKSYSKMYAFAQKNGASSGSGDFALMLFSKDRIEPNSRLEFILDDDANANSVSDSMADFALLNDNGWVVAVAQGPIKPGNMKDLLYVNIFATCAHGKRMRTAAFDTSMQQPAQASEPFQNPGQRKIAGQPNNQRAQQIEQATPQYQQHSPQQVQQPKQTEGPLGQGRMLLNPIFPDHVQFIQLRLKDLGYYKGPIDMEFGKQTKQALGDFAQQRGMPRDQWSLDLQKTLFTGSGQ